LENLELLLDKMTEAINRKVKNQMSPDFAMIGHLITEIKRRAQYLYPGDILMDLIAALYVREDENPSDMDMDLHKWKVEQFKKDSKGGLKDFFYNAGLKKYLPYLEKHTEESIQMHMATAKIQSQSLIDQMHRYGLENSLANK
jgi:hypothetical protein